MGERRVWPVFVAYLLAFVVILLLSAVAVAVVTSLYPEIPPAVLLRSLPGLLAGAAASSVALILTVLLATTRDAEPRALRLVPGRERGMDLALMILGLLALGQALDSLTVLAGFGRHGALWDARQALAGAAGEELFVRAFMQTRLGARWSPAPAVVLTSACFALMHLEWLHALLAFALGLYLGYITELSGSALPAAVAHVVNNTIFTLVTALGWGSTAPGPNMVLLAAGLVIFVACGLGLRRTLGARRE